MCHVCLLPFQRQSFLPLGQIPLPPFLCFPSPSPLPSISYLCPLSLPSVPLGQINLLSAENLVLGCLELTWRFPIREEDSSLSMTRESKPVSSISLQFLLEFPPRLNLSDEMMDWDPEVQDEVKPISTMLLLVPLFVHSNRIQTGPGLMPPFLVLSQDLSTTHSRATRERKGENDTKMEMYYNKYQERIKNQC